MNRFGNIYTLTSFGESHGPAMGGVIDGVPAGEIIDLADVALQMARRRPGSGRNVTQRREADTCEFLSGMMAVDAAGNPTGSVTAEKQRAITLGTPIGFVVRNCDSRSADYETLRTVCRPSHADRVWQQKYGLRDWRGGGRSSGRETVSRVVAGAIARQILGRRGVEISARIVEIGGDLEPSHFDTLLAEAAAAGDSLGAVVECVAKGVPAGLGEPVFGKLDQMLAGALMSIGGVKGVEIGAGFDLAGMQGSEANDAMKMCADGSVEFLSNNSGGIQGGISNSQPIIMRAAFKPTPTIALPQQTVTVDGKDIILEARGRHDPCIGVRAVPVVEAMAAITLLDAWLMNR